MPSKCSAVNYLGARVGLWQQFPLRGSSQRAGGSLSMRTSAQSQSTPNGESPTQQLQCKGTSLCLYAPQPGSSLTSPEGDERQKEAKPRWGKVSGLHQMVTGTGRQLSLFMEPKNLTQKAC